MYEENIFKEPQFIVYIVIYIDMTSLSYQTCVRGLGESPRWVVGYGFNQQHDTLELYIFSLLGSH